MESQNELMEKYALYQQLRSELESRAKQREMLNASLSEVASTINVLSDIKKLKEGEEMVIPLGSGAFVTATLKDSEKILVDLGSDTFIRKSTQDAIDFLKTRNEEIEKGLQTLTAEFMSLEGQVAQLGAELEKISMAAQPK